MSVLTFFFVGRLCRESGLVQVHHDAPVTEYDLPFHVGDHSVDVFHGHVAHTWKISLLVMCLVDISVLNIIV